MEIFSVLWLLFSAAEVCAAPPVSQGPTPALRGPPHPAERAVAPVTGEMATGELVPTHYPARRAAQVALHYLNLHHGSPFRVFGLEQVHKATAEDVGTGGRKYSLDFSVTDYASSGSALRCSADVVFPRTKPHCPPDVQLCCKELRTSCSPEEHAFYRKHISPDSAVSAHDIPDSHGNISEEVMPFWHLAHVAASFIMLRESSENTEYNMVKVASVSQQETREKQLMLQYHVLLHDIVSQEIIHWKLLSSWSPDGGVRVLHTEWQPKCPHATQPPTAH